jgi:hypothetical protein
VLIEQIRPLGARVAVHNPGSMRVLEKCGFAYVKTEHGFSDFLQTTIDNSRECFSFFACWTHFLENDSKVRFCVLDVVSRGSLQKVAGLLIYCADSRVVASCAVVTIIWECSS